MARKTALRAAILRAAAEILVRLSRRPPAEAPPPEMVCDERFEIRIEVRIKSAAGDGRGDSSGDGRLAAGPRPPHLTKLDRQILDAAVAGPQTMGQLARACDHDTDSYFRTRVRRLAREGLLVREGEGYRLA